MIVSRPFHGAVRGVGRNALDLPVAAFAAVAVAFLAFAMPGDLLTGLVDASGLPSLLPAAEPPLGFKARIGVGLAGAVAVFGLVFMLLRLLDRTGLDAPAARAAEAPRARRRDSHPDAPAPRPISATREFGEPAPPVAPMPLWLDTAQPEAAAAAPEPEPEPEPYPEPEPEPEPYSEPEPEPEPEPAPAAEAPASLADLMARLERGLQRKQGHRPAQPAPSAPAPQVFPEADDRLQSAIDSLQRLAARQS